MAEVYLLFISSSLLVDNLLWLTDESSVGGMFMFKFLLTKEALFSGATYFDLRSVSLVFGLREARGKLPELSSPTVEDV